MEIHYVCRIRRRRCKRCQELFDPVPQSKNTQKYCSKRSCQVFRQRQNEYTWRKLNPDCLNLQREQSRKWHKDHPQYSQERRNNDKGLMFRNVRLTRVRMRRCRSLVMFDKSKSIFLQLTGNKTIECFLSKGRRWLITRLTKASPLFKAHLFDYNSHHIFWRVNQLPKGRLHDISAVF